MKNKLLIIDSYGFIYRAYHVIKLTDNSGQSIGAIYGFGSMLIKLIEDFSPHHIVAVFDSPEKSFRKEFYPDYKSNRKEIPEDLKNQLDLTRKITSALGIYNLFAPSYEADDIIASLVESYKDIETEILIISSDKDLMQLINSKVKMYDPIKKKVIGESEVFEKFKVFPSSVVDYLSIIGDSSDNVPGIKGIGHVGALKLLQEFNNLNNILDNVDKIAQKALREKVIENKENAVLSKKLITLYKDLDLSSDINKSNNFKLNLDTKHASEFFKKLEFNSLSNRMLNLKSSLRLIENVKIEFLTKHDLLSLEKKIIEEGKLFIGIFHSEIIFSVQNEVFAIKFSENQAKNLILRLKSYIFSDSDDEFLDVESCIFIYNLIQNRSIDLIAFDLKELFYLFVAVNKYLIKKDSNFKAKFLDEQNISFSDLKDSFVSKYVINVFRKMEFDIDCISIAYYLASGFKLDETNLNRFVNVENFNNNFNLMVESFELIKIEISKNSSFKLYKNVDLKLAKILVEMELEGIRLDTDLMDMTSSEFKSQLHLIESKVHKLSGEEFNINSPKQMYEILYNKLNLIQKNSSTDVTVLEKLRNQGHIIADYLLLWRKISKLQHTYIEGIKKHLINNKIHANFDQVSTSTGRLTCTEPNLQNLPIKSEESEKIRSFFIAEEGKIFISADYSQIELRILAIMGKVNKLVECFKQKIDIHTETASKIFGIALENVSEDQRRKAKTINFGIIYGMNHYGLARRLNISVEEAVIYIERFFLEYPEIKIFNQETIKFAHENKYVKNYYGRKCFLNEENVSEFNRAAINAPIQSTCADIIKIAMTNLRKSLPDEVKIVSCIHDEIIFSVPKLKAFQYLDPIKHMMMQNLDFDIEIPVNCYVSENFVFKNHILNE